MAGWLMGQPFFDILPYIIENDYWSSSLLSPYSTHESSTRFHKVHASRTFMMEVSRSLMKPGVSFDLMNVCEGVWLPSREATFPCICS